MKLDKDQAKEFQRLVDALDKARDELRGFMQEVWDEAEEVIGNKSAKWQDSEVGQAAREASDEWQAAMEALDFDLDGIMGQGS